ncbi:hypothetical protein OSSY52_20860 [Tepiditoga spiralis]|uniref:Uncharacterized protein n=1 Tax=Tepiditoga spiralis TaxID=2108365 RepID=A0A7G1G6X1_9BACT|nr:hypothetical protein OSSY52_20860 [Tepiditoga spiralis]
MAINKPYHLVSKTPNLNKIGLKYHSPEKLFGRINIEINKKIEIIVINILK